MVSNRCRQRNLNNAFAYDLVPSPGVVTAALKAARRVNDFPTAVRIFEGRGEPSRTRLALSAPSSSSGIQTDSSDVGIKQKVENQQQYEQYLEELKPLREELGVNLKEDLYPEGTDSPHYNP